MTHEQPVALRCPARSYLRWLLVQLALLASFAMNHGASAQGSSATKVSVRSAAALLTASPGDRLPIAVELDIAPDWHVWTSEAQSRALPAGMTAFDGAIFTAIEVKASPATAAMVSVADIQWPAPHAVKGDLGEEALSVRLPLLKGRYTVTGFLLCEKAVHAYEQVEHCLVLNVRQTGLEQGLVAIPHQWLTPA